MCKFPAALPAHTPQRISGKSPNTLDLGQRRLESLEVGQGSNFMLGVVERLSLHEVNPTEALTWLGIYKLFLLSSTYYYHLSPLDINNYVMLSNVMLGNTNYY